jgi:16S rRNA processing protein RimM
MRERLAIGIVRTSHGINGFLKVRSLSGEVEHFLRLKRIYIRIREDWAPFAVEQASAAAGETVLLKLEGINSIEEAGRLRGMEIWADRAAAAPLKDGEYYLADLAGCRVLWQDEEIGKVKTVVEGGLSDFLEVVDPRGRTVLIPFTERSVGEVDVVAGTIVLKEEPLLP